jgi:hypothetical protein
VSYCDAAKLDVGAEAAFDRVVCDVPCSGDATLRKNADKWLRWNTAMGVGHHGQQLRILMRGLGEKIRLDVSVTLVLTLRVWKAAPRQMKDWSCSAAGSGRAAGVLHVFAQPGGERGGGGGGAFAAGRHGSAARRARAPRCTLEGGTAPLGRARSTPGAYSDAKKGLRNRHGGGFRGGG